MSGFAFWHVAVSLGDLLFPAFSKDHCVFICKGQAVQEDLGLLDS